MKFDFQNNNGEKLTGNLEVPSGDPVAFAIFAHCFTCSKNLSVTSSIARNLAKCGVATLRFDFTGLGNSDGDFANTNFSSNVQDLVSAFQAVKSHYKTPTLMIGHSLGGAAVLKASSMLPDIKAVVTIGAPSATEHVSHLFKESIAEINEKGHANVELAGRKFTIKKQFLDDINDTQVLESLNKSKKSFLILHSPLDNTVGIKHAEKIFLALRHPKSFISLDNADHLLTDRSDSEYVAKLISAWSEKYLL